MSCLLTRHDFYQLFPVLSFYPQMAKRHAFPLHHDLQRCKRRKNHTHLSFQRLAPMIMLPIFQRVTFDIQNSTASSSEKLQVIEHRGLRTQFQATRICPQRRHEKFSTLSAALGSFSFRAHGKSSFQLLLPSCSVPAKY